MSREERAQYERFFLAELRRKLDPDATVQRKLPGREWESVKRRETDCFWRRAEIEEIGLDTSRSEHEVVVLLRDLTRPECLFGWRAPAVAPEDSESFEPTPRYGLEDAAESHAMVVAVNLEEDVLATGYGFPKDCSPDRVTWF